MTFKPTCVFLAVTIFNFCALSKTMAQTGNAVSPQKVPIDKSSLNKKAGGTLKTGWYYVSDTPNIHKIQLEKTEEYYYINPTPIFIAKNITHLKIDTATSDVSLVMILDAAGRKAWGIATRYSIGKRLAFIVNGKLLETPIVASEIDAGIAALNNGNYSKAELEVIKTDILHSK